METRKVTIINSRTQSQHVIQDSRATTLGELKEEMRENGINFSDMTFFEGHMRAELKDDAAPLPTNIPYKGQVVNDLIFMLTVPDKKVKSGAMSRAEAYDAVKRLGLQDECKKRFGKNFTQCPTIDLISLIEKNNTREIEAAPIVEDTVSAETKTTLVQSGDCAKAISMLVEALCNDGLLDSDICDTILAVLSGSTVNITEKMSKREIDEMFNFVNK